MIQAVQFEVGGFDSTTLIRTLLPDAAIDETDKLNEIAGWLTTGSEVVTDSKPLTAVSPQPISGIRLFVTTKKKGSRRLASRHHVRLHSPTMNLGQHLRCQYRDRCYE